MSEIRLDTRDLGIFEGNDNPQADQVFQHQPSHRTRSSALLGVAGSAVLVAAKLLSQEVSTVGFIGVHADQNPPYLVATSQTGIYEIAHGQPQLQAVSGIYELPAFSKEDAQRVIDLRDANGTLHQVSRTQFNEAMDPANPVYVRTVEGTAAGKNVKATGEIPGQIKGDPQHGAWYEFFDKNGNPINPIDPNDHTPWFVATEAGVITEPTGAANTSPSNPKISFLFPAGTVSQNERVVSYILPEKKAGK